ncbi:MAG: flagellin FliC5 [Lachnospiraceae bacterium]|nr:flagellin FliC5 [Lachnospiraceae bacterium]
MGNIASVRRDSTYEKLSTGKKINGAADDAAGLAIAQKILKESNGYDVGAENIKHTNAAVNIAEGALGGITDYLQRIRELSVRASNGLMGQQDKESIQLEINQYLDGIRQMAASTEYNTLKLLDGNMADINVASNPDGRGMSIRMADGTLASLGIEGYDVTGDFDISRIDSALNMINARRSGLGAASNALEHAYNHNTNASLQLTAARSRIEDTDMAAAVTEQKKNQVMRDYQIYMQKVKMRDDAGILKLF